MDTKMPLLNGIKKKTKLTKSITAERAESDFRIYRKL